MRDPHILDALLAKEQEDVPSRPDFFDRLIEKAQAGPADGPIDGPASLSPVGLPPYTKADPSMPDERYPTTNLVVKPSNRIIRVRVADTPARRDLGFQNTPEPEDYDGMLFTWPGDANAQLHARNVDFPLSAQWLSSDGSYVDHSHLIPGDATPQSPKAAHRHVLEVPTRNWDALGLGPGSQVSMATEKDMEANGTIDPGKIPGSMSGYVPN
jgi:uncharacterized membrane protein (UPF0127 family)